MAKQKIIIQIEWEKENEPFFLNEFNIIMALNKTFKNYQIDFKIEEIENIITMDIFNKSLTNHPNML